MYKLTEDMLHRRDGLVSIEPIPSTSQIPRLYEGVKQTICPEYNELGIIVTGISREEENEYLPEVLGISVTDSDYRKQINNFWKNFGLVITDVETVLDLSNTKHFLQYRLALISRHVINPGATREDFPFATFIMKDELTEAKQSSKKKDKLFEAYSILHNMSDEEKSNFYKIVLPSVRKEAISPEVLKSKLQDVATSEPDKIIGLYNDPNKNYRILIEELLSNGILRVKGTTYYLNDDIIGLGRDEVIGFLKSPKNQTVLIALRKQLEEKKKIEIS